MPYLRPYQLHLVVGVLASTANTAAAAGTNWAILTNAANLVFKAPETGTPLIEVGETISIDPATGSIAVAKVVVADDVKGPGWCMADVVANVTALVQKVDGIEKLQVNIEEDNLALKENNSALVAKVDDLETKNTGVLDRLSAVEDDNLALKENITALVAKNAKQDIIIEELRAGGGRGGATPHFGILSFDTLSVTDAAVPFFKAVSAVVGVLQIYNSGITSLAAAFGSLATVTEALYIFGNAGLLTIGGFQELLSLVGPLAIHKNPVLASIEGFGSLTTVDGSFGIATNNELTNIAGFGNLTTVDRVFQIGGNPKLASVAKFTKLRKIQGSVYIYDNNGYKLDKTHFPALECVGGVSSSSDGMTTELAAHLQDIKKGNNAC